MTRIDEAEIQAGPLRPTPGQTVGPFFRFGLEYERCHEAAHPYAPGTIRLSGRVLDGAGAPIPDAILEIWQRDEDGSIPRARGSHRRDGHTFTGFARCATTDEGEFEFWTRNPGSADGEAPFFAVSVFARGLLDRLPTRIYLPEDEERLAADPLLSTLTDAERATMVAERTDDGNLRHTIRLQGPEETVFLAYASDRPE